MVKLPLYESEKEFLIGISRGYDTTYCALIAALLRQVIAKGLVEDLLRDEKLPKRYQRHRARTPARRTSQVLERFGVENVAKETTLTELLDVNPEQNADSKVVRLPTQARRAETFAELTRMWGLPGHHLDEECEGTLERWIEQWGELTPVEEKALAKAREARFAAYRQWRAEVQQLEQDIEEERLKVQRSATLRHRRSHQRQVDNLVGELRAFKVRTRWEKRDFGEEVPNE